MAHLHVDFERQSHTKKFYEHEKAHKYHQADLLAFVLDLLLCSIPLTLLVQETSFTMLTFTQKEAIRDAFVNYFWECVENE